ncbi:MAG: hypothetical protein GC152_12310 [Alphaproteobacteria bacterium]|nr:hypothetical protein [Alphaproteobacteria bacterium]
MTKDQSEATCVRDGPAALARNYLSEIRWGDRWRADAYSCHAADFDASSDKWPHRAPSRLVAN